MSWQEELRKLDEELAAGRLAADDYRVRRDQVLSSAVSNTNAPQPPSPTSGQSAGQSPPHNPAADSTQIISPVAAARNANAGDSGAEATQVVSGARAADPESTQFVPQQHISAPAQGRRDGNAQGGGGFGRPAPWNAPEGDSSPPWGGGDLPPIAPPSGGSDWISQGPEVFKDNNSGGGRGKVIAAVVAVVVLAGIPLGAYLIFGTGSTTAEGPNNPPASSAAPQAPPDPLPVPALPGRTEAHPEVTSFDQVPQLNYLNPQELSTYRALKPSDTKFTVQYLPNGSIAVLMLTKVADPKAAANAIPDLVQIQVGNGARPMNDAPAGITATEIGAKDGRQAQIRGHYVAGDVLVRIEVKSPNGLGTAESDFGTVTQAQMQALPPA